MGCSSSTVSDFILLIHLWPISLFQITYYFSVFSLYMASTCVNSKATRDIVFTADKLAEMRIVGQTLLRMSLLPPTSNVVVWPIELTTECLCIQQVPLCSSLLLLSLYTHIFQIPRSCMGGIKMLNLLRSSMLPST
ncbi:hypothetical protein ACHQM5_014044 [Ranunculus cassubicifolius]